MTVDMWCVCYECRMFYHCIIMDLDSVNKHLSLLFTCIYLFIVFISCLLYVVLCASIIA